jgi:hypothetical protein
MVPWRPRRKTNDLGCPFLAGSSASCTCVLFFLCGTGLLRHGGQARQGQEAGKGQCGRAVRAGGGGGQRQFANAMHAVNAPSWCAPWQLSTGLRTGWRAAGAVLRKPAGSKGAGEASQAASWALEKSWISRPRLLQCMQFGKQAAKQSTRDVLRALRGRPCPLAMAVLVCTKPPAPAPPGLFCSPVA